MTNNTINHEAGSKLTPVFVVGTGRCGSTLLSDIFNRHPDILSLSELLVFGADLGGRVAQAFPMHDIDGGDLQTILGGAHPRQTLMLRHDVMIDEALYRPGPGRRFTKESGIPALAATALPHLGGDPDVRFAEAMALMDDLPAGPAGQVYSAFFDRMRDRARARVWVERSGGSLRAAGALRYLFPEARFVHIVRDGRDVALSMQKHRSFRLALVAAQLTELLGVDPYESNDRSRAGELPPELACFLPERFDADAFRRFLVPLPLIGSYWSSEIATGLQALAGLCDDRLLTVRYEELLARPREVLERLFRFMLCGDPRLDLDACAAMVRAPRSAWQQLGAAEAEALSEACRPGFELLASQLPGMTWEKIAA